MADYDAEADMRRLTAALQQRLDQFGQHDLIPALERMEAAGASDDLLDQVMRGLIDAVRTYADQLEAELYG